MEFQPEHIYGLAAIVALVVVIVLLIWKDRGNPDAQARNVFEELRQKANDPGWLNAAEPVVQKSAILKIGLAGALKLIEMAKVLAPDNVDERLAIAEQLIARITDGLPNDAYPVVPPPSDKAAG